LKVHGIRDLVSINEQGSLFLYQKRGEIRGVAKWGKL